MGVAVIDQEPTDSTPIPALNNPLELIVELGASVDQIQGVPNASSAVNC